VAFDRDLFAGAEPDDVEFVSQLCRQIGADDSVDPNNKKTFHAHASLQR
jgi:hypothetical protein